MPFHQRTIEPRRVTRLSPRDGWIPVEENGRRKLRKPVLFSSLDEVGCHTLTNIIHQLSDLSRHASDIFLGIEMEAGMVFRRSCRIHCRLQSLQVEISKLDPKKIKIQSSHYAARIHKSVPTGFVPVEGAWPGSRGRPGPMRNKRDGHIFSLVNIRQLEFRQLDKQAEIQCVCQGFVFRDRICLFIIHIVQLMSDLLCDGKVPDLSQLDHLHQLKPAKSALDKKNKLANKRPILDENKDRKCSKIHLLTQIITKCGKTLRTPTHNCGTKRLSNAVIKVRQMLHFNSGEDPRPHHLNLRGRMLLIGQLSPPSDCSLRLSGPASAATGCDTSLAAASCRIGKVEHQ
ncbi:Wiskott-Aldrich syndrome protein family member 2 [Collichthys lucidus]|uniref:Wiskott-Aldrich syndrome protein family member 2 n=1 Tax=Collichthys lucidus TaxID=240159 RepID=A0A4U5UP37_COLLU|nr:Wiskott-Aldrich syndrome protein family member 2 [Collichthys lucidus]